jgi:uncharacterized protein (TIGR03083 family)
VLDLFPAERRSLVELLTGLTGEQWNMPTVCPGWTVRDVASHVLGVDIGNLSRRRDGFRDPGAAGPVGETWTELVTFLNQFNELWVAAARRISPRLLCELLAFTGEAIAAYFRGLDLSAMGGSVAWAGPDAAPVWLDVAREYTERWIHQQQIRDAVGLPGLKVPYYFAPVLATFVHALPHALRDVAASPGTCVRLTISGRAGGTWIAMRAEDIWLLGQDRDGPVAVTVTLDQEEAWRLFTRGMARNEVLERMHIAGDRALGEKVLDMVSIIA